MDPGHRHHPQHPHHHICLLCACCLLNFYQTHLSPPHTSQKNQGHSKMKSKIPILIAGIAFSFSSCSLGSSILHNVPQHHRLILLLIQHLQWWRGRCAGEVQSFRQWHLSVWMHFQKLLHSIFEVECNIDSKPGEEWGERVKEVTVLCLMETQCKVTCWTESICVKI